MVVCIVMCCGEDGHILRTLDFEVEAQRKKGMPKRTQGRKCEGWLEKERCTLPIKVQTA